MSIWLHGWAGDHAGKVEGRQLNRLLVALTRTEGTPIPSALHTKGDLDGIPWYYGINVTCLTPGARDAIATAVDLVGDYVWSIEVAETDWGVGKKDPWTPGVHLFSVMLVNLNELITYPSGTITTAVIGDKVVRADFSAAHYKAIYWDYTRRRQSR
jgi:hypothetical protein